MIILTNSMKICTKLSPISCCEGVENNGSNLTLKTLYEIVDYTSIRLTAKPLEHYKLTNRKQKWKLLKTENILQQI